MQMSCLLSNNLFSAKEQNENSAPTSAGAVLLLRVYSVYGYQDEIKIFYECLNLRPVFVGEVFGNLLHYGIRDVEGACL